MSKGFSSMRASFQPGIFKIKIKNRCAPVLITVLWKTCFKSIAKN